MLRVAFDRARWVAEHDDGVGDAAVGDEVLHAIEEEATARSFERGGHLAGVAAGLGLRESESEEFLASHGCGQVLPLEGIAAPGLNRIRANTQMPGEEGADAGAFATDAGQSFEIREVIRAATAELRLHVDPEQIVFLGQRSELFIEAMLDVAEFFVRSQFLAERLGIGSEFGGVERHDRLRVRYRNCMPTPISLAR